MCTSVGGCCWFIGWSEILLCFAAPWCYELAELAYKSIKREGSGINGIEKVMKLGIDENTIVERVYRLYKELCS